SLIEATRRFAGRALQRASARHWERNRIHRGDSRDASSPGSRRVEARLRSPTVKSSPRIYGPTSLSSSMPRAAQSCSKFERDRSWIRRPLLQALCDAHDAGFNLIGCPQAPLIDKRVILGACRPQRRARIGLGEIHVDRERLPEDEANILQARNMSVGIDVEILRRLAFRIWPDRHVLVRNADLLEHPQRTACTRPGLTEKLQH